MGARQSGQAYPGLDERAHPRERFVRGQAVGEHRVDHPDAALPAIDTPNSTASTARQPNRDRIPLDREADNADDEKDGAERRLDVAEVEVPHESSPSGIASAMTS